MYVSKPLSRSPHFNTYFFNGPFSFIDLNQDQTFNIFFYTFKWILEHTCSLAILTKIITFLVILTKMYNFSNNSNKNLTFLTILTKILTFLAILTKILTSLTILIKILTFLTKILTFLLFYPLFSFVTFFIKKIYKNGIRLSLACIFIRCVLTFLQ
jgi:hypothetical protein